MSFLFYRWSPATLALFPAPLQKFYASNPMPVQDNTGKALYEKVDKHYRKLKSK